MKQRGGGRIVNVTSIGGKMSIPHMVPYSAAKFAATGLSQGLRVELAKDNIFRHHRVPAHHAPGLVLQRRHERPASQRVHHRQFAQRQPADFDERLNDCAPADCAGV
jgi:short-subunit dehydrogenase